MKKLVYKDVAPYAKQLFVPTITGIEAYSNPTWLKSDNIELPTVFNPCELYLYPLDGNREIIPDDLSDVYSLLSTVSDGDGNINVVITMTATAYFASQGISLTFGETSGAYANEVNIKWYNDDTLLDDVDFTPDSTMYFFSNYISGYNKLVVTLTHLNMSNAKMEIRSFDYGVTRTFEGSEIPAVSLIQEIYPVGLSSNGTTPAVSTNTTDFTIRASSDDLDLIFQKKQVLEMYFDNQLQSVTMVDTATRTGDNSYDVESSDYVGAVLAKVYFVGGIYDGTVSARSVLEEISIKTLVPFEIDDDIDDMLLGYIPYTTCQSAIAAICFAVGAVINTANSSSVKIYKLSPEVVSEVPVSLVFSETVTTEDKLTSFELTSYAYSLGDSETTLYEDGETGDSIFVTFSAPMHTLSITSGTIVESGPNYAIINASDGCVLTGLSYSVSTSVTTVKNPDILSSDLENTKSVTSCTLINKNNVYSIANLCYNYLSKQTKFNGDVAILNNETTGDTITQKTRYSGDIEGVITEKRYAINSTKIVAEVTVR